MNIFDCKQLFLTLLFFTVASVDTLSAQSVSDSIKLQEVVVTEKYWNREARSTAPVQLLTEKTIRNLNVLQLSDAVKHFSGVTVRDYGGIGGLKTVSVRSLGAAHTAVNYDGIAVTDVQTGQIDIGRFSLDNVGNISLISGQDDQIFKPASAFASASSLNITSIAPSFEKSARIGGRASVKGGSFGMFNPALTLHTKLSDKLSATMSGEWLSANGSYPYVLHYGTAGVDSSSVEQRENTDVNNLRLETALFVRISEKSKGNLRVYYYQSERGLPGATIFYNTENFSKQRLWDRTFFTQGRFEHSFSWRWSVQINAKHNRGYLRYLDPTYLGSSGKMEDIFRQYESFGSVSALYRAFENVSVSISTDLSHSRMYSDRRENFATPARLTSQSVLAAKWVSDNVLASVSLLYTQTFELVLEGEPADDQTKFSPYASISVQPFSNINLRLRAFYKNSFRLPTFNDLYYPSMGKRDLFPEDADQFNLGVTYASSVGNVMPLLTFAVDGYYNRVKNKIVAYPTGNLHVWRMTNTDKVQITGLDLSTEAVVRVNNKANLLFGATYTFQRAVDVTDPDKITYNNQLPYTPRHSGSARAALETDLFNIAYALIYSGKRYSNPYNGKEFRMSGYADHSISLAKSFDTRTGKINLSVEALNLADKNYEIVKNYPMPGRSYRANISMNF